MRKIKILVTKSFSIHGNIGLKEDNNNNLNSNNQDPIKIPLIATMINPSRMKRQR
jgi:hypothetical protein